MNRPSQPVQPGSGAGNRSRNFSGKVAFFLFDAIAKLIADEALERDVGTQFLGKVGDNCLHTVFAINDEHLLVQDHFFVVLLDPTDDHLLDDFLGLAGLARLLGQNVLFTLQQGWVEIVDGG